jgi:hypothetical protein
MGVSDVAMSSGDVAAAWEVMPEVEGTTASEKVIHDDEAENLLVGGQALPAGNDLHRPDVQGLVRRRSRRSMPMGIWGLDG